MQQMQSSFQHLEQLFGAMEPRSAYTCQSVAAKSNRKMKAHDSYNGLGSSGAMLGVLLGAMQAIATCSRTLKA